jgi:hypothetical protein
VLVRRKRFVIPMTDEDRIEVEFEKEEGRLQRFVVNYVATIGGREFAVVRFDTAHGFPHRDVLLPNGTHHSQDALPPIGHHDLMWRAVRDVRDNWMTYRRRFEKWLT